MRGGNGGELAKKWSGMLGAVRDPALNGIGQLIRGAHIRWAQSGQSTPNGLLVLWENGQSVNGRRVIDTVRIGCECGLAELAPPEVRARVA